MRFPLGMTLETAGHIVKHKMRRSKRFPLVLMLEPLHACNLTCTGCGRIREYESTIKDKLTLQECLQAVDEANAPIVSICGGEPLIYPDIAELCARIRQKRKQVILCTNGVFIERKLHQFKPSNRFIFNVHLDGLEETHDMAVERQGVFKQAIQGIKAAKAKGFRVSTNTTVYQQTDLAELDQLFAYLTELGVDTFMLSPAYGYAAVHSTNPDGAKEIFLTRDQIQEKFQEADKLLSKYKLATSPIYMEFLQGKRHLDCTAWANPTRNIKGWKGPCYLITDKHYKTFDELMNKTEWHQYGYGKDERCEHCMTHCGFEPSAALGSGNSVRDTVKMLRWQFS